MKEYLKCPHCGAMVVKYKNPLPTADIIITRGNQVLLIKRKNPPEGWALPGGFIDYGESAEQAAIREAKEETNLEIRNPKQFHTYSQPGRDPRFHTLTVVFSAEAKGELKAGDDAGEVRFFPINNLPENIAFDHKEIIKEFFASLSSPI